MNAVSTRAGAYVGDCWNLSRGGRRQAVPGRPKRRRRSHADVETSSGLEPHDKLRYGTGDCGDCGDCMIVEDSPPLRHR